MAIRGADVDFGRGEGLTLPHVLAADASGGTVLVVGLTPFVLSGSGGATGDLVNVYSGGGTHTVIGLSNGSVADAGTKVFWDDTAKKFTGGTGGAGNQHFGWSLPDQGATSDNDEVEVIHDPDGSVGS